MHHEFWHERWRTREIGFHQSAVHPFLERWWPRLGLAPGARVYVPLCGKSLDLAWLAERGHGVVGSELSAVAIGEFFAEHGLEPTVTTEGRHRRHAAGPYEIFEGDALDLTPALVGLVDAIYDRAALVALPPDLRVVHARVLAELAGPRAAMLLVAFEYAQEMKGGPPFSVESAEVAQLFGRGCTIEEVERVDILAGSPKFAELGIPALHETGYVLRRT